MDIEGIYVLSRQVSVSQQVVPGRCQNGGSSKTVVVPATQSDRESNAPLSKSKGR